MKAVFDVSRRWREEATFGISYLYPDRSPFVSIARDAWNDWVILRERGPSRKSHGYFAVARLVGFGPDAGNPSSRVATFEDFLAFTSNPGLRIHGIYPEFEARTVARRSLVGLKFRDAIRPLSDEDFTMLIMGGFAKTLGLKDVTLETADLDQHGFDEPSSTFDFEPREITTVLQNRHFRDENFRIVGCRAYQWTCAVCGLSARDRDGNAEVQAAHIIEVPRGKLDTVQNCICLSGSAHWMFDRYLFTIGEDFRLIVAPTVTTRTKAFFPADGELHWPRKPSDLPHPSYLADHRTRFRTFWGLKAEPNHRQR